MPTSSSSTFPWNWGYSFMKRPSEGWAEVNQQFTLSIPLEMLERVRVQQGLEYFMDFSKPFPPHYARPSLTGLFNLIFLGKVYFHGSRMDVEPY